MFAGTRVPLRILMEHLEAGDRLDDFLDDYPTVTREQAVGPARTGYGATSGRYPMKVLLDESVPRRLASAFPESFGTRTVQQMGWAGCSNGELLRLAADPVNGVRTEPSPGLAGTCAYCGRAMIPKCGRYVRWHWAHKRRIGCDPWHETETAWHLMVEGLLSEAVAGNGACRRANRGKAHRGCQGRQRIRRGGPAFPDFGG